MTTRLTTRPLAFALALALAACGPAAAPPEEPRTAARAALTAGAPQRLLPGARVSHCGASVAMDGDTLAVGAPRDGDMSAARGAVHVYQRDTASGEWALARTIRLADGLDGDEFGSAVALSGDVLLVAARGRDEVVQNTGAVYVYERNQGGAGSWGLQARLSDPNPAPARAFGTAVAVAGSWALATTGTPSASAPGRAYLYARDQGAAGNWGLVKELPTCRAESGQRYGASAAIAGDVAVVGAPANSGFVFAPGDSMACVFQRDVNGAGAWGLAKALSSGDSGASLDFGTAVAALADVVAVGDPNSAGAVYLFARNLGGADAWGLEKKALAADGILSDQLGARLSLSGDLLVAGVPAAGPAGASSGAAYVFARNQGGLGFWGRVAKLGRAGALAHEAFGSSVAVSGGRVASGAPFAFTSAPEAGGVTLFERDRGGTGAFGQAAELSVRAGLVVDRRVNARFGGAAAASGDLAVVGASGALAGGRTGTAYVYVRDLGGPGAWGLAERLVGTAPGPESFGAALAASGDLVAVGAPSSSTIGAGAAYLFARDQGGPGAFGLLRRFAASGTGPLDTFGAAVAVDGDLFAVGTSGAGTGGRVELYARNQGGPDAWGLLRTFESAVSGARFGGTVALVGDLLAIGATGDGTGKAFVYLRDRGGPDAWGLAATLAPADAAASAFGVVQATATRVAVGESWSSGTASGLSVTTFDRGRGGPDTFGATQRLSWSGRGTLALLGDLMLIGRPSVYSYGSNSGSFELLAWSGSPLDAWYGASLPSPHLASYDALGSSVALGTDFALVGAPGQDLASGAYDAGAAYLYTLAATDSCATNPCQNGATCTSTASGAVCTCQPGWTGSDCSANADDCAPNPCQNGGACTDLVNGFSCACAAGWNGPTCTVNVDGCAPNPCQNGGTCTDLVNGFSCACATGFWGPSCEYADQCTPSPCLHGSCANVAPGGVPAASCSCEPGWSGARCDMNADECAANPCQNGGTCTDLVNGYSCACGSGWSGPTCAVPADPCAPSPCQHGGACSPQHLPDGTSSAACRCTEGWYGPTCSQAGTCSPSPCLNGGTCTPLATPTGGTVPSCTCAAGWTGSTCATAVDACTPGPCQNGGTCSVTAGGFTCTCPAGWTGPACATAADPCAPNPCLSGGTCSATATGFACTCPSGWTGPTCASDVNECLAGACSTDASCQNTPGGYTCTCLLGFQGDGRTCTATGGAAVGSGPQGGGCSSGSAGAGSLALLLAGFLARAAPARRRGPRRAPAAAPGR